MANTHACVLPSHFRPSSSLSLARKINSYIVIRCEASQRDRDFLLPTQFYRLSFTFIRVECLPHSSITYNRRQNFDTFLNFFRTFVLFENVAARLRVAISRTPIDASEVIFSLGPRTVFRESSAPGTCVPLSSHQDELPSYQFPPASRSRVEVEMQLEGCTLGAW